MSNRVISFILSVAVMVVIVGSILLLATYINKRITKKEQEQISEKENEGEE